MSKSDQQLLQVMHRIGGLLFKRLHEELTETDRVNLEEWMDQQDPVSRQFFEEMTDWEKIQVALQDLYQFDEKAAFEDLQKKIHLENVLAISTSIESTPIERKKYRFLAAAAVLILLIGTAVVFTMTKGKPDNSPLPVAQRYKNDVPPGGDRAMLTLADGSQIVLDSVGKGELARQGTTRVIKLDNGQLAYHVPSSSSAPSVSYNTISTPRGGQYQVLLPDGSKVWLNAASSLRFPTSFTGKERRVELSGEAYFQVTKNSVAPFKVVVVSPKPMQIEVLGTEFDVEAYSDEDGRKATLIDGAVRVSAGEQETILKPGQQAKVMNSTSSLNVIPDANTEEAVAWKNGLFQFQDASIQSIMRQVGRWYDVDIVYKGKVEQQFIGKIPRQAQVSTVLKILESTGWVHFMIDGKTITVAP